MIAPPTVLAGRYRLHELRARGGMADVYEAVDEVLGRRVAVKLLRGVEPEHARRFAGEVAVLAQLDHPGLVRLFDAGEHDDVPFLVMELVDGPTLGSVLEGGPLGPTRTAEIAHPLATALAAIHARDIVHRDVKPDNVLLSPNAGVRLADFGVARLLDAGRATATGSTIGTPAYLAPEQVESRPTGPPADVYSLGLVLLECLTGRREFDGAPTEAAMARLARDPVVPDDLPGQWRSLLTQMTARDPDRRPTATEVAQRVRVEEDEPPTVPNPALSPADVAGDGTRTMSPPPASPSATDTLVLRTPPPVEPEVDDVAVGAPPRRGFPVIDWRAWRWALVVAAVVLTVLVVALVARDEGSLSGVTEPSLSTPEQSVPTEGLDRALDRLEELVRP